MDMIDPTLKTPSRSFGLSTAGSLVIPASPAMKKLGFGTGVHVFLMERFSPNRGLYGSPWAVKKINSQLKRPIKLLLDASDDGSGGNNVEDDSAGAVCRKRLYEEAKLLRSLDHPNIIGFRGYSKAADGAQCLLMESGERDLYSILEDLSENEEPPLSPRQILTVCVGMAAALRYLHESARLLHGDMKAANVLVKGDFNQVKLCDFGVCLKLNDKLVACKKEQCYVGTECWCPPEVLHETSEVTDKADIFASGLVIWECIALMPPHVHLLSTPEAEDDLSVAEQEVLSDQREAVFYKALGTRPCFPPSVGDLSVNYHPLIEAFYHCTAEQPQKRPSAAALVQFFASVGPAVLLNQSHITINQENAVELGKVTLNCGKVTLDYGVKKGQEETPMEKGKHEVENKTVHSQGKVILDLSKPEITPLTPSNRMLPDTKTQEQMDLS